VGLPRPTRSTPETLGCSGQRAWVGHRRRRACAR
jgi:hypothetical protein